MGHAEFLNAVEDCVKIFNDLKGNVVRVVGNLDTDGITAFSILCKAFHREKIRFCGSFVRQITRELLDSLKNEGYEVIFFLDLGSGVLEMIEEVLNGRKVFVLDHHYPDKFGAGDFIVHLNPHLFGIDGTKEISASGVTYLFARALSGKNVDLSYLAVVGAIGDIQEVEEEFIGLNKVIMDDAVKHGGVRVLNGLNIFGAYTKPAHKVLEYSTNPYIPGVTGNEERAIKFLEGLGVQVRDAKGKYKKFKDLSRGDVEKIFEKIFLSGYKIAGRSYLLEGEDEDSYASDLREFSTLLNACGRMGRGGIGVGCCLGDAVAREKAVDVLNEYRRQIIDGLNWFYRNKDKMLEREGYVIINAGGFVGDHIVGTLMSIISKSNLYEDGTVIVGMAHTISGETKVSMRLSGFGKGKVDLRKTIKEICSRIGGQGGGHSLAAGALIKQEKEEEFLRVSEEVLGKAVLEETVS